MKKAFIFITLIALIIVSCTSNKKESAVSKEVLEQYSTPKEGKKESNKLGHFNLKPIQPKNGKLKGVVELGASGFNSFIIEVDKDLNWEAKKKEFGNSLILEGMTSGADVNSKLKDYIQKIVEFGVNPKDIHFVISSGAAKEKVTILISEELKKIGYVVNTVTPEQEGIYALKSVLPMRFTNTAFVVDMGSGNTKISYFNQDGTITGLETYGAKYFQKNIDNEKVATEVKEVTAKVPHEKTIECFIIGGVPYKLAKSSRDDKSRYTVLSTNIADYTKLAEEEGKKVASGLTIYNAIIESTGTKKFIFDWDANFTIGFLLSETN